jgi:hypothetical protein
VSVAEWFIQTSVMATQQEFWFKFNQWDAPSYNSVLLRVSKWCEEGSV